MRFTGSSKTNLTRRVENSNLCLWIVDCLALLRPNLAAKHPKTIFSL